MRVDFSSTAAAAAPPPPPPPSPSASDPKPDPADKARQLIRDAQRQDCTVNLPVIGGVNCRQETEGEKVGAQIAQIAQSDPAYARAVNDAAMSQVSSEQDRKEIARGVTASL